MNPISEKDVGPHRLIKETEQILAVQFGGSPSESEIASIVDAMVEAAAGKPVLVLVDLTRVETFSAAARRAAAAVANRLDLRGVAMHGASFHMRVVAKLVAGAIALFMKSELPQEFFDDRTTARAWLDRLAQSEVPA